MCNRWLALCEHTALQTVTMRMCVQSIIGGMGFGLWHALVAAPPAGLAACIKRLRCG